MPQMGSYLAQICFFGNEFEVVRYSKNLINILWILEHVDFHTNDQGEN